MDGIWWKLPVLRELTMLRRGIVEAASTMIGLSVCLFIFLSFIAPPRPDEGLLEALAGIGSTLLIAYVVEVTWLVHASSSRPLEEREKRLGALTGIAGSAFIGVGLAIALAARVHAGHWLLIDRLGFGFVLGTLLMAGIFVVMQPVLAHEWMDDPAGLNSEPDDLEPDVH
jgi:hypothetical protein